MMRNWKGLTLVCACLAPISLGLVSALWADVVCDKFEIESKLSEKTLQLFLDTDLPSNTIVMVSVSRSYFEKGNTAQYSLDYFSEKGTVGDWKMARKISIDSDRWKSALREKQKKMSRMGLGFQVASISDRISISIVVSEPTSHPNI